MYKYSWPAIHGNRNGVFRSHLEENGDLKCESFGRVNDDFALTDELDINAITNRPKERITKKNRSQGGMR